MNYEEAKNLHKKEWYKGLNNEQEKVYEFPYNHLHNDDTFIIVNIMLDEIKLQEVLSYKVNNYKYMLEQGTLLSYPWLSYGKRMQNGDVSPNWHNMFYAVDGNHRITAMKELKMKTGKVIIPKSHYELYERK